MTQEQWILYLYGIWPGSGWLNFALVLLIASASILLLLPEHPEEKRLNFFAKIGFIISILMLLTKTILPSKDIFLAMVVAPDVVKSAEQGKIKKISDVLDKALEVLDKKLEQETNDLKGKK